MINIIVPIVERVKEYQTFIDKASKRGVKIFVGIRESLAGEFKANKNTEIHIYTDKSKKEEIINSLHSCKMAYGKVLIVRRPLTDTEYEKLTTSNKDIVTLKAKHNKFVKAIKNFATNVIRRIFAFSFFEDISAICYGENMFDLLSVCANLSMASRINHYVGLDIEEIVTTEKPVKKEYNKFKNVLKFLIYWLILGGSVAGGVLVCMLTPLYALTVIAVVFWIIMALMLWLVGLVNFTRAVTVGQLRYGRGEEKEIIKEKRRKK